MKRYTTLKRTVVILCALLLTVVLCFASACACSGDPDNPLPETPVDENPETGRSYIPLLDGMKKADWTGEWIWTEENVPDAYAAFRKTFELAEVSAAATAYVAAESKYYLWINGELAVYDGGLKRGPTPTDGYYDEIDISDHLVTGKNTIAFLVVYNGRPSFSSTDPGRGGLLFDIEAGSVRFGSDTSVKAKRLTAYKNAADLGEDYPNYKQYESLAERNVFYDARDGIGEFYAKDYDDSAWESAANVCAAGAKPFGGLYMRPTPPFAFDKTYSEFVNSADYVGRALSEDTVLELELPVNMQFSPYFELDAPAGKRITYHTENFERCSSFCDDYVTTEGRQKYEHYAWRSGQTLYVKAPAGVTFTRLAYRASGYDSSPTGKFVSGDADLDILREKSLNTLLVCMRDTFMDCPDRERAPYIGDVVNQMQMSFYALDTASYALAKKSFLATAAWMRADQNMYSCVPGTNGFGHTAQNLAFIVSAYDYCLYTGDLNTIKIFYPAALNYLKFWKMNTDNTVRLSKTDLQDWQDWGTGIDKVALTNAWYYYALGNMKKTAALLEISADDAFYDKRMGQIKEGYKQFETAAGYKSAKVSACDDRANAIAFLSGVASTEMTDKILSVLKTREQSSPYMEKYALEALCRMGEFAYSKTRMVNRYRGMIEQDYSTLAEEWDVEKAGITLNHGWSGGPLTIMGQYYAGIAPTSAGYATYRVCPQNLFDGMAATVDTVRGKISVAVTKTANGYEIKIASVGKGCELVVPPTFGSSVKVTGGAYTKGVADADGAHFALEEKGEYTVVVV